MDAYDINLDKIPPQAIDLEEVVLGALMLEPESINDIVKYFKPEIFYKDSNQKIAQSILDLFTDNKRIDILTVTEKLRANKQLDEAGGALYVTQLTSRVASSKHAEDHIKIVYEKYIKRSYIRIASEIQKASYDDSLMLDDIKDYVEKELSQINEIFDTSDIEHIFNIGVKRLSEYWEITNSKDELLGVPCGLTKVDRNTHGWQKNDLIIIAARPSIGKTFFALHFAINAARFNYPVLFFSLEMSKEQLFDRAISIYTGIDSSQIKGGKLAESELQQLETHTATMNSLPIYIDDTPSLHVFEFKSKCRRFIQKHGVKLIIVDYLQLMRGNKEKNGNREQEISNISRSLKTLAKEQCVPVIALSQLNRDADNKKPTLSHLRESGAIEQDADMVTFIYREKDYQTSVMSLEGEFIIAKHRNGTTGQVDFYLNNHSMTELSDTPIQNNGF